MRAAVVERYGPPSVARVEQVPRPQPGKGEVLVRVHSAAVTSADARIRAARFPRGFGAIARLVFGVRAPRRKVLGAAFSGIVEAVGAGVSEFDVGDQVCGMSGARLGAHAEFLVIDRARLVAVPAGVTHDQAAGVLFGGTTALHYLRDKACLRSGQAVLVNGAAGAVGTNAVQLATHFGATVTGVASAANAPLLADLGASSAIDHASTDLSAIPGRFDVVLDAVGNVSRRTGLALLAPGGVLLLVAADLWDTVRAVGRVKAGPSPERAADFTTLLELVASGRLRVVIDAVYPLDRIVDAYHRVDSGRKRGNVIVHMSGH